MAVEESDRSALLRAAAQSWGEEAADTLSELLPPSGDRPATQRDIEGVLTAMNAMDARLTAELRALREATDARFDAMHARFDAVESRFDTVESRFDTVESRFDAMEGRFDAMDAQLATFGERLDGYGHGIDAKLESVVDRITASFERRISDAVTTQTRTLVFSQLGALVVIAALAFGLR